MSDPDPQELADRLEEEADRLQKETDRLGAEITEAREDWERKRSDAGVPGARPGDSPSAGGQPQSPSPEAPPPEEGPSRAEQAPELQVGPPADSGSD